MSGVAVPDAPLVRNGNAAATSAATKARNRAWWMSSTFSVFLGLDPDGKRLHDGPLPNTERKLRALFDKLAVHGPLLVVVDQPATIGALPVAVARAAGHQVASYPHW